MKNYTHESIVLNALLGKKVKITFFDDDTAVGILQRATYNPGYYHIEGDTNIDFRKSHIKEIDEIESTGSAPLTVEQINALKVGEWVWAIMFEKNAGAYFQIEECINPITMLPFKKLRHKGNYSSDTYGMSWIAYKNKEEAEVNVYAYARTC